MKLIAFIIPFIAVSATLVAATTHMKSQMHHSLVSMTEEPLPTNLAQLESGHANSLGEFVEYLYHRLKKLEDKVEGFKEEFHTEQLYIVDEASSEGAEKDAWLLQVEGYGAPTSYRAFVIRDLTEPGDDNRVAWYGKSIDTTYTYGSPAGNTYP